MRIAYFGGTFDPPHVAHYKIAERVLELKLSDKVLFAPAFAPPHKDNENISSFENRLEMVRIMCTGRKDMSVSDIEQKLKFNPSYTLKVLEALSSLYQSDSLQLLIGGDSLRTLHLWFEATQLVNGYEILSYPRPGEVADLKYLQQFWPEEQAKKLFKSQFKAEFYDVSSSELREKMRKNEDVDGLICENVEVYIKQNNLYQR